MTGHPKAIENLLTGLIDYAGLFPPASLDMRTAVSNYFQYQRGSRRMALGRFVVSLDRMSDLYAAAGEDAGEIRLSVVVPPNASLNRLVEMLGDEGDRVALEFKVGAASEVERIHSQLPSHCERYFELPFGAGHEALLDVVAASGARVKLRMGGVMAEAFPGTSAVAAMLKQLAQRRVPFKATAGLHHPVRSAHPLTDKPRSPIETMNGFLNLAFASALLYFGGSEAEALKILEEQDSGAWCVEPNAIHCRGSAWTTVELTELRNDFFISFGSCSFEDPIRDLEVMGWL